MVAIGSSLSQYQQISRNLPQAVATYQKSTPTYQRAVDAFTAALPNIKSIDDLLANRQALTVALGAFQLESQVDAKALLKQVLTQDPADQNSLVNKLADPRYKQFAAAFGSLATDGGAAINEAGFADKIVGGFATNQFEESVGEDSPAVREALYFSRTAAQATTIFQVLSDPTLGDVVRTAEGMPAEAGGLDVQTQVDDLTRAGFDVTNLQDPAFVAKFVQKYLVMEDASNPSADPSGGIVGLFSQESGDGTDNGDPLDVSSGILNVIA